MQSGSGGAARRRGRSPCARRAATPREPARRVAQALDQPARLGGALHPRDHDAVHARVERRPRAPGVRAGGGARAAAPAARAAICERLHVARREGAVLEVDPDEVQGVGHELRERDGRQGQDGPDEGVAPAQAIGKGGGEVSVQECESYDDFGRAT